MRNNGNIYSLHEYFFIFFFLKKKKKQIYNNSFFDITLLNLCKTYYNSINYIYFFNFNIWSCILKNKQINK